MLLFFQIAFALFLFLLLATTVASLFFKVPYVPSKNHVTKYILEKAKLKPGEKIYDLGCGDARVLIMAEKEYKAIGIGFEIAPLIFILGFLRKIISASKFKIYLKNFHKTSLKDADVIFCYLTPTALKNLVPKIKKECQKGTRIYSNTFRIPDLKPKKIFPPNPSKEIPVIYFYQI